MIHDSVRDAFLAFTQPLEGRVPSLYFDIKDLITTGVGNLCNTPDQAVAIKGWVIDGRPATDREIRGDWMALRAEEDRRIRTNEKRLSGLHWRYAQPYTRIRLPDAAIDALVLAKLASNVAHMTRNHFPDMGYWPADAQLGVCSMAWACGPDFPKTFKNFAAAAKKQDWTGAVAACTIKEAGNPGIVPRNKANRICFQNAAMVLSSGADKSRLWWPSQAPAEAFDPAEADTEPAVPHPGPRPEALAGDVSVAGAVVSEALKDMAKTE